MQVKSKNIDLNGIHKSASITFYSKKRGYLLCMEFRDNKLVYHPIGGKYEDKDKNIEKTAFFNTELFPINSDIIEFHLFDSLYCLENSTKLCKNNIQFEILSNF
jgi:hypothetical protein